MVDSGQGLESPTTGLDSGEATIIIPAIVLAESLYLAEKGGIKARSEQTFEMVDNALNYRIYPLNLTIIQKAWELKRLTEIHDRMIVASEASQLRTHH